jgi:hypothetical protein
MKHITRGCAWDPIHRLLTPGLLSRSTQSVGALSLSLSLLIPRYGFITSAENSDRFILAARIIVYTMQRADACGGDLDKAFYPFSWLTAEVPLSLPLSPPVNYVRECRAELDGPAGV